MRFFGLSLCTVLVMGILPAQEFSPSVRWLGSLRVRGEVDMRDFDLKTAANTYTLLRARLGAEARPTENVTVVIEAQDSRVFGQERDGSGAFSTLADTRNLDLHQGFIEVRKLFSEVLTLKLGRQELVYGNERIIGSVGWSNVGRSFDGVVFRYHNSMIAFDILAMNVGEVQVYPSAATPPAIQYQRDSGADLFGVYASLTGYPDHIFDGYFLYQWDRKQTIPGSSDLNRVTLGTFARGVLGPLDYEVELGYQMGRRRGLDVAAYMLAGTVGYTLEGSVFRRIAVGYDHLSGTPAGAANHRSFDPVFHTGHKFYGFMDYFIVFPGHVLDRGLTDLFARTTLNLSASVIVNVWIHQFAYEREVVGKKALGQEVDCVVVYKYNSAVGFELGSSAFLPDELMRQRFGGAGTSFWGYLAALVTF